MLKRLSLFMFTPFCTMAEIPSNYDVVSAYQIEGQRCAPTVYHVKNQTSSVVRPIEVSNPCRVVDFSREESDVTDNWSAYNAYQIARQSSFTKPALSDWHIVHENGNCLATSYQLQNAITQETIAAQIDAPCQKINFYHDQKIKHDYVVSSQIAALIGKDTTQGCDVIVHDDNTLAAAISSATLDNNGYHICLQPGEYTALRLENKRNISFIGVNGMASFIDSLPLEGSSLQSGVIEVANSENIEFFNINIKNTHLYRMHPEDPEASGTNHQVSRALHILDSNNIGFYYSNIESKGKQAIKTHNASATIKNTSISCYYFCVDGAYSSIDLLDTSIYTLNEAYTSDTHSVFWTNYSDFNINNLSVFASSGKGLFSGAASPDRNRINISGRTQITGDLVGWIQNHFNYFGIELALSGTQGQDYPVLSDFYNNNYRGGGPSYGSKVIKNRSL